MLSKLLNNLKTLQHLRLYGIIGLLSVIILSLIALLVGDDKPSVPSKSPSYKADIASGTSRLDHKEVWAEKLKVEYDNQSQRIDALQQSLDALLKMISQPKAETAPSHVSVPAEAPSAPDSAALIEGTRESIKQTQGNSEFMERGGSQISAFSIAQIHANQPKKRFHSKGIQRTVVSLVNAKNNKNLKSVDNTIPAGAFAGAVMVGGVDASTSIQASGDPRPVLLRVTDHGTLPRKFKSDLQGCHVLAACYGDLSSERVYMRLEKLTCTERKTGEVVEMNVQGYVAGEDGRAGLRGVVVDKAGPVMRNAAIGGFLSGMGSFLSQSKSPITFSPSNGLAQTNPMTDPEMLRHGAAKGASNALEKYAEFFIKRAEQMQPILQIQAGRRVDIVFTQGVAFESSASRDTLIRVNDQQRLSQLQSHDPQKPIEAWVPSQEIAR
jgi:conjugal transfer pilus assembly protein TraB